MILCVSVALWPISRCLAARGTSATGCSAIALGTAARDPSVESSKRSPHARRARHVVIGPANSRHARAGTPYQDRHACVTAANRGCDNVMSWDRACLRRSWRSVSVRRSWGLRAWPSIALRRRSRARRSPTRHFGAPYASLCDFGLRSCWSNCCETEGVAIAVPLPRSAFGSVATASINESFPRELGVLDTDLMRELERRLSIVLQW